MLSWHGTLSGIPASASQHVVGHIDPGHLSGRTHLNRRLRTAERTFFACGMPLLLLVVLTARDHHHSAAVPPVTSMPEIVAFPSRTSLPRKKRAPSGLIFRADAN